LTYKGISLSFLIDAKFGGSIYSGTYSTGIYTGVLEETYRVAMPNMVVFSMLIARMFHTMMVSFLMA
jgi:hypothetical protein